MCSALALADQAGAAEPWLSVEEGSGCATEIAELERGIEDMMIGVPNRDVVAEVAFVESARTVARVRLRAGSRVIGLKQVEAATCRDAADVVTAVVALALSSLPRAASPSRVESSVASSLESPARANRPALAASSPFEQGAVRGESDRDDAGRQLLLGLGVDSGSLVTPTLVVRVGAATQLGVGQLRGIGWYGLPSVREEVDAQLERTRADFGAGALEYCLLAGEGWLAACGGAEAGLRRVSRVVESTAEPRTESERTSFMLSAVGGVELSLRHRSVQPGLSVSAQIPIAGAIEGRSFGLRAVFGAGVPF